MMRRFAMTGSALVVIGCASQLETEARMFRHFGQAREIQNAAVFGQVERARDAAGRMLEDPSIPGVRSGPRLEAFHRAAQAVRAVDDPADLAGPSADLALACGGCHETRGVAPVFAMGRAPEREGVQGHMVVHAWAIDRMWESQIARSDELWREGLGTLSERPIQPEEFAPWVSDRETAFMLSSRIHNLAGSGMEPLGWSERADLLARVSRTCWQCHDLAGIP